MGGTLLLADDSITIQKVVELTFAETEHKVIACGNGRDLFKRLPEVKPDVVLCDVVMPDMNGYEVCQTLKSDPATLHIPVVLLTGTFEPFDRDRALGAGCDAIVTKPFEARELINVVEDLIKRAQSMPAAPAETGMGDQGIPEGVPALDFSASSFQRLAPPPPPPVPAPEDGIDLTASSLGDSNPPTPRPAPPELQEPATPSTLGETPVVAVTPPEAFPPAATQPLPTAELRAFASEGTASPDFAPRGTDEPEPPQPRVEPPAMVSPAPLDAASVFTAAEPSILPTSERAMSEGPTQRFLVQPVPPAAAAAPSPPSDVISDDVIELIARRALELAPGSAARTQGQLTDEQVDRIAKRVVELAGPQLERIAWEVIPDMAEMLVRKRIAELEAAADEEN